jgi:hypothetical protein
MASNTERVVTYVHTASGLLKATWGTHDYSAMAWHGCTIHAIHFGEYEDNRVQILEDGTVDTEFDDLDDTVAWHFLLLDIDYIVSWAEPQTPGAEPSYWIAPATLEFASASSITATISDDSSSPVLLAPGTTATTTLIMSNVERTEPRGNEEPRWQITGTGLDIRLYAPRFDLYIRTTPQLATRSSLEMTERGGVSFARHSFA